MEADAFSPSPCQKGKKRAEFQSHQGLHSEFQVKQSNILRQGAAKDQQNGVNTANENGSLGHTCLTDEERSLFLVVGSLRKSEHVRLRMSLSEESQRDNSGFKGRKSKSSLNSN